jgi:hypothetical protein
MDTNSNVPPSAAWLGALGALPFIGLAGAAPFLESAPRIFVVHALAAYGAVILSFLGGVHWGLAIGSQSHADHQALRTRLSVSVIPSLAAWVALLFTEKTGLLILAAAIAVMLWVDIRATRDGNAPRWYPKLRIPLTAVVVLVLLLGSSV